MSDYICEECFEDFSKFSDLAKHKSQLHSINSDQSNVNTKRETKLGVII